MEKTFKIITEDGKHVVSVKRNNIFGTMEITVDKDKYKVQGKPFGIGLPHRERFIVGESQAILVIEKGGNVKIEASKNIKISEIK